MTLFKSMPVQTYSNMSTADVSTITGSIMHGIESGSIMHGIPFLFFRYSLGHEYRLKFGASLETARGTWTMQIILLASDVSNANQALQ